MKRDATLYTSEPAASEKRLAFEKFLADLAARFVAVAPEHIDDEIRNALHEVVNFFRIDYSSLLRLLPGKTHWVITHSAARTGNLPFPVETVLPVSLVPHCYQTLTEQREPVRFARLEDLPEAGATDRQTMESWKIRSGLYIPIAALKSTAEYTLGTSSSEHDRSCPEEYIPRLRLLGALFVNALERSMGEKALRESEERLSLAASAAEAGLWIMEMDRGIVWATEKFRELFNFGLEEELPFERFLAVIHPDDGKRVKMLIRRSLKRQEDFNLEYRIVLPGGMVRWISTRGKPFPRTAEIPERLMGASIDATERRQMEGELRERLDEIERLKHQLETENVFLREEIRTGQGLQKLVGNSEGLQYVFFKIRQVAPTDATVLILGETGTGKGLVAHAIHEMSNRRDKPMITVNCAALPANLIESELFGREKGAFTGAHAKQVGRFEVAHGGTIFLDEIGEMPLELQAKLLRVLQEGEFERLGSPRTIKVDARVIASTSRDLKAEVRNNRFREDLFYRLNVFPVSIPPLRMRSGDIPQLVQHFVESYGRKIGRRITSIPKNTMKALQEYSWPGNVRELEHMIERAVITSTGPVMRLTEWLEPEPPAAKDGPLDELAAMEREHILKVLQKTRWRINGEGGAAALLKINPSTLRFRIKKLGIERP